MSDTPATDRLHHELTGDFATNVLRDPADALDEALADVRFSLAALERAFPTSDGACESIARIGLGLIGNALGMIEAALGREERIAEGEF